MLPFPSNRRTMSRDRGTHLTKPLLPPLVTLTSCTCRSRLVNHNGPAPTLVECFHITAVLTPAPALAPGLVLAARIPEARPAVIKCIVVARCISSFFKHNATRGINCLSRATLQSQYTPSTSDPVSPDHAQGASASLLLSFCDPKKLPGPRTQSGRLSGRRWATTAGCRPGRGLTRWPWRHRPPRSL